LFSVAGVAVGASVVAGAVVLVEDSGAAVVAGSSALLQPAKNVKVIKAVAISNLLFIIVFSLNLKLIHSIFFKKYQVVVMLTQELLLLAIKQPLLSGAG
jgi:hypothetical protein